MYKHNHVNIDLVEYPLLEGLGILALISAIRMGYIGCKRLLFLLRIAIHKGHQVLFGLSDSQSFFATIESRFFNFYKFGK
jgi:hypothetical protein